MVAHAVQLVTAAGKRGSTASSTSVSTSLSRSTSHTSTTTSSDGVGLGGGGAKTAAALDGKEEDAAVQLARADTACRQQERGTKALLTATMACVVLVSAAVLLGTVWQRSLLEQYEDDYETLKLASATGFEAVEWAKGGYLRVLAENADHVVANQVDGTFVAEWHELFRESGTEMQRLLTQLYQVAAPDVVVQDALTSFQRLHTHLSQLFADTEPFLGRGNSSEAVPLLEGPRGYSGLVDLQRAAQALTNDIQGVSEQHRTTLLTLNSVSIALVCTSLVVVLVALAAGRYRLQRQRSLQREVLNAVRRCHKVDARWQHHREKTLSASSTPTAASNSRVSMSKSVSHTEAQALRTPARQQVHVSEAQRKFWKAARRVRVTLVVLVVVSLTSSASLLASQLLTRGVVSRSHMAEFLLVWFEGPVLLTTMNALQWSAMYSGLPRPALQHLASKLAIIPYAGVQMEAVVCGEGDQYLDPDLLDGMLGVCDFNAAVTAAGLLPTCALHYLPEHLKKASLAPYGNSMTIFLVDTLALVSAVPLILLPHDRRDAEVMSFLGDTGEGTLECYSCAGLYERNPECTDDFLEYLLMKPEGLHGFIGEARNTMRSLPRNSTRALVQEAQPFLDELHDVQYQDMSDVTSATVVSMVLVSAGVLLVCACAVVLWLQEGKRQRRQRSVRQEQEWDLLRILLHRRTYVLFHEFASSNLAHESTLFWTRCEEARREGWPGWMCVQLWREFVAPGAEHEINIDNQRRETILSTVQPFWDDSQLARAALLSKDERKPFAEAQKDVFELLSDNFYHKFLCSPEFEQFLHERERLVQEKVDIMEHLHS